jgi:alkylated DNA repair dioxygenase AlkB
MEMDGRFLINMGPDGNGELDPNEVAALNEFASLLAPPASEKPAQASEVDSDVVIVKLKRKKAVVNPVTRKQLNETSWVDSGVIPATLEYDFEDLWSLHPDEYSEVKMMGRVVKTPRWQQTYGKAYFYTGMEHKALDLPEEFEPFLEWANSLGYGGTFNQVLINWYASGEHYIGPHSDNTKPLVKDSPIVSISLGQTRTFRITDSKTKEVVMDVEMPDKSYLVMGGKMQDFFKHEVLKVTGKRGQEMGRRINITFRQFAE